MQFSGNWSSNVGRRNPYITNYRRHVTRCNLELQLAMASKQSVQSLQKVEHSSAMYNPEKFQDNLQRKACYTLQPGHLQVVSQQHCSTDCKEISPCNTKLYNSAKLFVTIAEVFQNHCKLQPETPTYNMSLATCYEFLFSKLQDKLQRKSHDVTLDLEMTQSTLDLHRNKDQC